MCIRDRYQTDKRKQDCYICGSYKKRTADCTAHFIRTDLLTAGVLSNLRKVTSYAEKHEARFMKLLIEQNEDGTDKVRRTVMGAFLVVAANITVLLALVRLVSLLIHDTAAVRTEQYAGEQTHFIIAVWAFALFAKLLHPFPCLGCLLYTSRCV